MPDLSLESFCSYLEEIGIVDIDLLSDFLESYNNYKKKPLQEALFITMIKFFRDNYIHNEDNLNRLCKRLIESYNKSIAVQKVESIKKLSLIVKNKQNTFKSVFFANLKSRNQIEHVMRKYVKGYSREKIRRKKMSRSNSNICSPKKDLSDTQSFNNYSYSNYSTNNFNNNLRSSKNKYFSGNNQEGNFNNTNYNNYNTITSSVYNNTSGSNLRSNFYNTEKTINRNSPKINRRDKTNISKGKDVNQNNSTSKVFERLNSHSKISRKKSLNNSVNEYIIPSRELKEMKELEQCTFQPKINYYYPSCKDTNSNHYYNSITGNTEEDQYENVHERLFRQQVHIKEKKNIKSLEKMISDSKVLTFQPYISPISRVLAKNSRSRSLNKILNKTVDNWDTKKKYGVDSDVFLRNMEKNKQASEKMKMTNYLIRQKELSREFTYSPSINRNYKSKNSSNSKNQLNDYGSYDFSYLNCKVIKVNSPKNEEKLPVFSRKKGYNNENIYPDYKVNNQKYSERNDSKFKRSRSKSKSNARNKSNNKRNFQQINRNEKSGRQNYNNNFKKTNYAQEELLTKEDFDVSDIPYEKRSQSVIYNLANKEKSSNFKSEAKIDNKINFILKQNKNKDKTDNSNNNNDFHFNYNFKNEHFSGAEDNNEDIDFNNNSSYTKTNQKQNQTKEIFDKLYNNAEELKMKKMILTNEIYSEKHGITFKPNINQNSKYYTNSNFYEREMNFLKSKKDNIEKLLEESKQKELASIRKSRTLSKEEKDRNTRNIVERLYKKQMEKLKEIQAKKQEEDKNTEAELKKCKKSNEEIKLNNQKIVQRLYAAEIGKIKEQFNVSKKLNKEELQKSHEVIENENLNKIKQSNKKKYITVQSRVFTGSASAKNNNNNNINNKNKSVSPSNNRSNSKSQSVNLLNKLKKEHKIKFKYEELSSPSKSKEKDFNCVNEKNESETRIKKTEDSSPNRTSIFQENSKNAFNFMDSINSNTNRNSLLQSNSSVGGVVDQRKKSNSKIVKPIRASDFNKKNYTNNSNYLLESNNVYLKKSSSRNSNEKNNNFDSASNIEVNKNLLKKNSSIKDYENLSKNHNENSHSLLEMNALSNKSSLRDGECLNSNANNTTTYNNSNTKATNATNISKTNKFELTNSKEPNENQIGVLSDNSDNSRGIEVKENKFKSKGLEKILSGRK